MDEQMKRHIIELCRQASIVITPSWISQAVIAKHPRMTIGLANSRAYEPDDNMEHSEN